MAYVFHRMHPPLLRNEVDILSIPRDSLREQVGFSEWTADTVWRSKPSSGQFQPIPTSKRYHTKFTMTRELIWVIVKGPTHYSTEMSLEENVVEGFNETRRKTMESSLGLTVGGPIPLIGLNATAQASLKLTEEVTTGWKKETTIKSTRKFAAGRTYVTWNLIDNLVLKKHIHTDHYRRNDLVSRDDQVVATDLPIIVNHYEDSDDANPGSGAAKLASAISSKNLITIPEYMVRTSWT
jgi:hypothetical protein